MKAICKNKEFNNTFNKYYKSVQRRSDELARIKKHIRKTQRKRSRNQRKRAASNAAAYDSKSNTPTPDLVDAPDTPSISQAKSSPISLSSSNLNNLTVNPKKRISIC